MVEYIDLPSRKFCPLHKCYFSKDSSCSSCDIHPLIAYGNAKSQKDTSKDFTNNLLTITNKSRRVYVKKRIIERFHAYRVKFNALVNWEALFQYEEVSLKNNVKFKRIDFSEGIVRVFRKSILVTLRSSREIKGLPIKEAKKISDSLVLKVLEQLPKSIVVKDLEKISSVHNAFINHPFAERDIKVIDKNNEIRFISDNSKGNPEFEAINTKFAISDSEAIEKDTLELVDKGLSRDFLARAINSLIEDRKYYAENLRSHVEAINTLSDSIKEFKKEVRKDKVKKLKEVWW